MFIIHREKDTPLLVIKVTNSQQYQWAITMSRIISIKRSGDGVGLTESPGVLPQLMITGLDMKRISEEFEDSLSNPSSNVMP